MSNPHAFLALARRMLGLKAKKLGDAPARRAVSTAYYALFHLLTDAATGLFVSAGSPHAAVLRRTYDHGPMKTVSAMAGAGNLPKLFGLPGTFNLPEDLKTVGKAFVELQVEREAADYDLTRPLSMEKAGELVALAERAFQAWESVGGTDEARIYLASFLMFQSWSKEPHRKPKKNTETSEDATP